jgi:hypothetical protein
VPSLPCPSLSYLSTTLLVLKINVCLRMLRCVVCVFFFEKGMIGFDLDPGPSLESVEVRRGGGAKAIRLNDMIDATTVKKIQERDEMRDEMKEEIQIEMNDDEVDLGHVIGTGDIANTYIYVQEV